MSFKNAASEMFIMNGRVNKILFIVGPTGTGKTKLALKLAYKFNGDLVSADSRQVYKGMDIGTGKDIPKNFKLETFDFKISNEKINYYSDGKIRIWGYDLVDPDQDFSVTDWVRSLAPVIQKICQEGKLPIIVGGTGLYVRALIRDLPEIFIPRNDKLRNQLNKLSVTQLQTKLKQLSYTKFKSMNTSDQNNPRRLIRAIEVQKSKLSIINHQSSVPLLRDVLKAPRLLIGLTDAKGGIYKRIERRVRQRVKQGIIQEIRSLLDKGYHWDLPAFSALGYCVWQEYFNKSAKMTHSEKEKLKNEIIQKWIISEQKYAKRQITWFKKEPEILWFDITTQNYPKLVLQAVRRWYNQRSNEVKLEFNN